MFVVEFIEAASKADEALLTKAVISLSYLLMDEAVAVTKRALQGVTNIYRTTFRRVSTGKRLDTNKACC